MVGCLATVNPAKLQNLIANPDQVEGYLYPEEESLPSNETETSSLACLTIDIDKAWHGIHFLLTGTAYKCDRAKPSSWAILVLKTAIWISYG